MSKKTFQLGKNYKHTSGKTLYICGLVKTKTYGICLIGENEKGQFQTVGSKEEHFINWKEVK